MSQTENVESHQNTNEKRKKQNVESENEHARWLVGANTNPHQVTKDSKPI